MCLKPLGTRGRCSHNNPTFKSEIATHPSESLHRWEDWVRETKASGTSEWPEAVPPPGATAAPAPSPA